VMEGWDDEKRKKTVGVMQSQGVSPDRKQKKRQHSEQTEGGYRHTRAMTASTARAGTGDVGGGIVGDGAMATKTTAARAVLAEAVEAAAWTTTT